ncbi:mechanosensitive ion channel family protein [Pseudactinotalea sp.]|uniref:mechanosensitive ion channel family protein n=1 Tax=Pseudactinotalea sp. TaxID=1926260 RepID=UPI003B3A38F4
MPIDADAPVAQAFALPLRIAIIALVAVAVTLLLRFVVSRVIRRLSRIPTKQFGAGENAKIVLGDPNRVGQRLQTFQSVLNSTIAIVVGSVAVLMILSEVGVQVAPLLASAGVVGVALAFGAQSLVRDVISGVFMLVEDQYGVGDWVELGATGTVMAAGTVERVALRITTIRDDDGRVWHIRNGEIMRVANESQGWSHAVAQVQVQPRTEITAARDVMLSVTELLRSEEPYRDAILDDPEVRVEEISGAGITLRWSVRTRPGQQWRVASAMRRRLTTAFAEHGIELV